LLSDYRPWRKIRPIARDVGRDPEDAWAMVKWARIAGCRTLPLYQADGRPFSLSSCAEILQSLHKIDRTTGGGGPAAFAPETGGLGDPVIRDRFRIKTLMDEAAESSLIEGAATTRKEAIELLKSGRDPATVAEHMVVNNYVAMQRIKQLLDRPLSVEMLLELQSILTRDTLANPDEAGRLRRPDENVRVVDDRSGEDIFVPPLAEWLPKRMESLCKFANTPHDSGSSFIHPVVKACILHFMIGYEHPFCDGNGRTARAVFYWFALKSGYGIFEYAAISEIIRKGFARYPQAYIDSELDDGDLTYFVLYKLDIIEQALERLAEHIRDEQAKIERSRAFLRLAKGLNLRQRLLLEHALRHPLTQYTVKSHANSNGIVLATSRADLEELVRLRLMTTAKKGKQVLYLASPDLERKLNRGTRK
jgi:Fic family protein